jgi:predicted dehydrogenase
MLENKQIDAIVIATPDKFHAPAVGLAARAGKDILCEKPLALNLADAHASLAAVSKSRQASAGRFHAALRSCLRRRYAAN